MLQLHLCMVSRSFDGHTALCCHVFPGLAHHLHRYFLFTYITTTTVPSFPQIQDQYTIGYSQVNWTVAIPALGLAFGPLFWSSLADIYGRRIIFIVGTIIALVASVGSAVASSYGGYMAARFFQGFGVSPGATVGMAVVGEYVRTDDRPTEVVR